ncbi:MAG: Ig-like domain-containing protein [Gammaproteobacteria bacterium]|nr:Ig-like domain-containing protein [Gammaproteobacteria bacterium]MDH5802566.1 Ig-like domain-containing protein [Gammaproteobacteria bacterium]
MILLNLGSYKKHAITKYTLHLLFLLSSLSCSPLLAQTFVYVYDQSGQLLTPSNAATNCPDPGQTRAGDHCKGVLVDDNGEYELRLDTLPSGNLLLLANSYRVVSAATPGAADTFVLLKSKRRLDSLNARQINPGVDINAVSEAGVVALENYHHIPKTRTDLITPLLAGAVAGVDAPALNRALGTSHSDNYSVETVTQQTIDILVDQLDDLSLADEQTLVELAKLAIQYQGSNTAVTYIRKNTQQALTQPDTFTEVRDRVFNHISSIVENTEPVLVLEADKYMLFPQELAQLSTINSVNPAQFFAYTWLGTSSINSAATFSKPEIGSYLVCATGEIENSSNSSTDCVRLAVKEQVIAIARSSEKRIGTNNQLRVSGSTSIGANRYRWSGPGQFDNTSAETTIWTAPAVSGSYALTLTVNDEVMDRISVEVFDVLPVSIAEAQPAVIVLDAGWASTQLLSGSISTDGSAVDQLEWTILSTPSGANATIQDSNGAETVFNTNTAGDYRIQLSAQKGSLSHSTEIDIQVRVPGVPVAIAGEDLVTFRNTSTMLDGSRSYITDSSLLQYLWSSTNATLLYPEASVSYFNSGTIGQYSVQLVVSANGVSSTDQLTVTVENQLPAVSDHVEANLLNEIMTANVVGMDNDGDSITYELLSSTKSGGITMDSTTGQYTYIPGGIKGCRYKPSSPVNNQNGGMEVPVIKLCADRYTASLGEVIHLTTSNSIHASQFSGYQWQGGAVGDSNDITSASYTGTTAGLHQVCVVGSIGQSANTSTACVDVLIESNGSVDDNVETGYIDSFTYRANDGFGNSNTGKVVLTIGWKNSVPEVSNLNLSTNEDTPVSGELIGTDADGHSLTFRILGNGSLGTAVITNPDTGAFSYTPNNNAFGQDRFTVVSHDGYEDSVAGTVTVTITGTNDYPLAFYVGTLNTLEDNAVSGVLGGSDPDDDELEFRLATVPEKGDVLITNTQTGSFVYTPHANKNGTDQFFFVVYDGLVESNTAPVNINITPVNDPPVATGSSHSVNTDEVLSGQLDAVDVDLDVLAYLAAAQPTKGTLVIDSDTGVFTYTPNGELGTDSFGFTASDGLLQSNAATVQITVLPANSAPLAQDDAIVVFENVTYGGVAPAEDVENQPLTYHLVSPPRLGAVTFNPDNSGHYSYTPRFNTKGNDYFTYKVNDGDKDSAVATVQINIIPASVSCAGPGNMRRDTDGDGYADFIEADFGTSAVDPLSTPFGADANSYGVSYADDDDSDAYVDIHELWLMTNLKDANSKPSLSTLNGVPNCLTPLLDSVPPALFAFSILTPTIDASGGTAKARFALSVIDNAVGVKTVQVSLRSPNGQTVKADYSAASQPLVLYTQFDSEVFSRYADDGVWTVAEIKIIDVLGNPLSLSREDLLALNYPASITVTNVNADVVAPTLNAFAILTPNVDVTPGDAVAQVQLNVSDNVSGLQLLSVTIRSPSGKNYRWAQETRADQLPNLDITLSTNIFPVHSETGIWTVSELKLADHAKNEQVWNTLDLQSQGFPTDITVIGAPLDTTPPQLLQLDTLTPVVDVTPGNEQATLFVSATDDFGIAEVNLTLQLPSGSIIEVPLRTLDLPLTVSTRLNSATFPQSTLPGFCEYLQLSITDSSGNTAIWNTQQLAALGFVTRFEIRNNGMFGIHNNTPFAYGGSIVTLEDTPYSSYFEAYDIESDPLKFIVVDSPQKGSVIFTNNATGEFTFTPRANEFGEDSFTFKVDDGYSESDTVTVYVHIVPNPDPTLGEHMEITVVENTSYLGNFKASDADKEPIGATAHGAVNGTISVMSGTSFEYVPDTNFIGSDSFFYQVSDGNSVSQEYTVTVNVVPDTALINFTILTPIVSAYDTFVPIEAEVTLTKAIASVNEVILTLEGPSGQVVGFHSFVPETGYPILMKQNVYTPSQPLEPGVWTFKNLLVKKDNSAFSTVVATDIEAEGFNDTVEVAANTSPQCTSADTYAAVLGEPRSGFLSAVDPEGNTMSYILAQKSGKGRVSINTQTGVFTYTATALGQDFFLFAVSDGISTSTNCSIIFNNTAANGAPVALSDTYAVKSGKSFSGVLSASDPNDDALVYEIVTASTKGQVNIIDNATGKFIYWPNSDSLGADSFSFKVNDGLSDSNIAVVDLTINAQNTPPTVHTTEIFVFQSVAYNGVLSVTDADNDNLNYTVSRNGSLGSININATTGAYTYIPLNGILGQDYVTVKVSDTEAFSEAQILVHIISTEQACGTGGIEPRSDTDGDGYVNFVETAFSTDINNPTSTPFGLDATQMGVLFTDDDDADSITDHMELWYGSDPTDVNSVPQYVLQQCFNPLSDGIKPRLIGFNILTDTVDVSNGTAPISFDITLMDNASGIKRARLTLVSPSGTFVTSSVSFTNFPLITGARLSTQDLSSYSEQGTWQVYAMTLFDEAGNRLDLNQDDFTQAGYATAVNVINSNSDTSAPVLISLTVLSPIVYPGTADDKMMLNLDVSDNSSGISSARVDFISASGTIVTASTTLSNPTTTAVLTLSTGTLSQHLEQGQWSVLSVMLVDAAGNSVQYQQTDLNTTLQVTNPLSDTLAPTVSYFSVVTKNVTAGSGSAVMSFALSVADDISGISKVRVDITGPSGQVMSAWGDFSSSQPLQSDTIISTSPLSTMLELGTWNITAVEIQDDAGNRTQLSLLDLFVLGYDTEIIVE